MDNNTSPGGSRSLGSINVNSARCASWRHSYFRSKSASKNKRIVNVTRQLDIRAWCQSMFYQRNLLKILVCFISFVSTSRNCTVAWSLPVDCTILMIDNVRYIFHALIALIKQSRWFYLLRDDIVKTVIWASSVNYCVFSNMICRYFLSQGNAHLNWHFLTAFIGFLLRRAESWYRWESFFPYAISAIGGAIVSEDAYIKFVNIQTLWSKGDKNEIIRLEKMSMNRSNIYRRLLCLLENCLW